MIYTFFITDEIVIISSSKILDNENLEFRVIRNFVFNHPLSTMRLIDQVDHVNTIFPPSVIMLRYFNENNMIARAYCNIYNPVQLTTTNNWAYWKNRNP